MVVKGHLNGVLWRYVSSFRPFVKPCRPLTALTLRPRHSNPSPNHFVRRALAPTCVQSRANCVAPIPLYSPVVWEALKTVSPLRAANVTIEGKPVFRRCSSLWTIQQASRSQHSLALFFAAVETTVSSARGFSEETGSTGDLFPRGCRPRRQDSRCWPANCGVVGGTDVANRFRF